MKKYVIKVSDIILFFVTGGLWIFVILYKLHVNYMGKYSANKPQDDLIKVKVVGVTFKNGRKSRQTILRKLKFSDPPFDEDINIELKRDAYEGKLAIGVYVNDEQIGNIPKELTGKIDKIMDDIMNIDIEVYGGWEDKSFGCELLINIKKRGRKMKKRIRSIIFGFLVSAILCVIVAAAPAIQWKYIQVTYADYKIYVNGEKFEAADKNGVIEPFSYNGWIYAPFEHIAKSLDKGVRWDGDTHSFYVYEKVTDAQEIKFSAKLDNYAPGRNETINLIVTGLEGLPYKAIVNYKTTQTEYDGKVGELCPIKVSSATPDFRVIVYILVTDEKNNTEYELATSFIPV